MTQLEEKREEAHSYSREKKTLFSKAGLGFLIFRALAI